MEGSSCGSSREEGAKLLTPAPRLHADTLPSSPRLLLPVAKSTAEIHLPFVSQHLTVAPEPCSFLLPKASEIDPCSSQQGLIYCERPGS